jgi:hypothetical protein
MEPVIGPVDVPLEPLTVQPVKPHEAFFSAAESLLTGAGIIAESGQNASVAFTFLCGQATECFLKAFLSHRGFDLDTLKSAAFRHDIGKLWSAAMSRALPLGDPMPPWADCLDELHDNPYYLRYPMGLHGIVLPGIDPMLSELQRIREMVRSAIK